MPDISLKTLRFFALRFGELEVQEKSFLHGGLEAALENDFSATWTREVFTKGLKPVPTSPELQAARRKPASVDELKVCHCKLDVLCWLATLYRPDICARLARIAARVN